MKPLALILVSALLLPGCSKNIDAITDSPHTASVYEVASNITVTQAELASMNQKNTNYAYWYEVMQDKTIGKNTNAEMSRQKAQGNKINLVIGNSLFNKWVTIDDAFPRSKVFNRAFGGALAEHVLPFLDDLGVEYADNLFLYFGENEFLANFRKDLIDDAMIKAVKYWREKNPKLKVVFVELQVCPSLWVDPAVLFNPASSGNKEIESLLNSKLREFARTVSYVRVADMNRAMKTSWYPYEPRSECFVTETVNGKTQQVHMNAEGYEIWRRVLTPFMVR
jgi:lysophospholipase L1-like esterase